MKGAADETSLDFRVGYRRGAEEERRAIRQWLSDARPQVAVAGAKFGRASGSFVADAVVQFLDRRMQEAAKALAEAEKKIGEAKAKR